MFQDDDPNDRALGELGEQGHRSLGDVTTSPFEVLLHLSKDSGASRILTSSVVAFCLPIFFSFF